VRQGGERGLGLPQHIGVALTTAPIEHLNQAVACHVEIFVRCNAARQVVTRERVHEHGVNARMVLESLFFDEAPAITGKARRPKT
jgi:hypothetical protein